MKKIALMALLSLFACKATHNKKEVSTNIEAVKTEKKTVFDSLYNKLIEGQAFAKDNSKVTISVFEDTKENTFPDNYPDSPIFFDGNNYTCEVIKTSDYDSIYVVSKKRPRKIKAIAVSDWRGARTIINKHTRRGINIGMDHSTQTGSSIVQQDKGQVHKEDRSEENKKTQIYHYVKKNTTINDFITEYKNLLIIIGIGILLLLIYKNTKK